MEKCRIEISAESGDVYLLGSNENRAIGHIEDFLRQKTPLAKAVKACWDKYLLKLDRLAGEAVQALERENARITLPNHGQ